MTRLRAELQGDLDAAKADIQLKVGNVVTELHGKMSTVDDALRKLESAGQALFEKMDTEKAETVTKLQSIMADAGSEFEKHKGVINKVADDVQTTKKDSMAMIVGHREEMDGIKATIQSLSSTASSGGPAAAASCELRLELDALASELVKLRSTMVSGGPAAAPHGGWGK